VKDLYLAAFPFWRASRDLDLGFPLCSVWEGVVVQVGWPAETRHAHLGSTLHSPAVRMRLITFMYKQPGIRNMCMWRRTLHVWVEVDKDEVCIMHGNSLCTCSVIEKDGGKEELE
jgi:hypothetical protein